MDRDYIAAVDIGTTKIVAIVGRKDANGKVKILGVGETPSKGVKRGVVYNVEETAGSIIEAVKIARESSGIDFRDVFVGIAGQHIKSIRNRHSKRIERDFDEITAEDVKQLTDDVYNISLAAGEEIIHVIPQNYIIDNGQLLENAIGASGKKLEGNFHIIIGQTNYATYIKRSVERAGLNVIKLILEPIASAEAVLSTDEKELGVALVDIGGGTTDLAIYYDGILRHTAVVPLGGNVVTNDIKEGCAILYRTAEQLKVEFGSALSSKSDESKVVSIPGVEGREPKEISFRNLASIIQARMEDIIDGVFFQIENSGYAKNLKSGIIITGGGSTLKKLPQLIKFKTGFDVHVGHPNRYVSSDGNSTLNSPKYATSIGLIIKGYDYMQTLKASNTTIEVEKEKDIEPKVKKQGGLFDTIKKSVNNLFDDKGTTM